MPTPMASQNAVAMTQTIPDRHFFPPALGAITPMLPSFDGRLNVNSQSRSEALPENLSKEPASYTLVLSSYNTGTTTLRKCLK